MPEKFAAPEGEPRSDEAGREENLPQERAPETDAQL